LSDRKRIEQWKNKYMGERCFCIGNGPSLKQTPLHLLEGEYTFRLNRIADIYPRTTWRPSFYVNVTRQPTQTEFARSAANAAQETTSFLSKRYAHLVMAEAEFDISDNVILLNVAPLRVVPLVVWSQDIAETISKYGTSMLSVLQIAVYMGFNPIYLVGCDGEFEPYKYGEGDPNHFSPDYGNFFNPGQGAEFSPSFCEATTARWDRGLRIAKDVCDKLGVKIYNATIGGDVEIYPRVDLLEVLNDIRS